MSALSPENISGVYLPSAVLVVGSFILKKEWAPFAVALAASYVAYKLLSGGSPKPRKVLNPTEFQNFVLQEKNDISHNVTIYRFALPRPTDILGLPIGQHISLAATIEGQPKEVVRSYTPISSDNEAGYFDLLVKAYPQGNISKYLTTLEVGQTMKVRGPKGAFVYTPNMCRHFGMIAGGTGITPMLQIIKAIVRNRPRNGGNDTTQVDLIFANVNPDDILLKDELEKLIAEDDGFRVYYVLNNPPEGWTGGVGFVTPDMITERLPAPANDIKILLCGPPPMVSAMKKATESLGYTKARPVSKLEDQVFCF
ncbi:cytochrome b5 reductase family protein [Aspergillus mulundensis]|uniref:NADH-cytochrome b5 reductase n=1 Tax=Aspergillus mulundensis TaxID=1810919 RepID=A0A3D8RS31_9EURO|nr:NADH-cytochrome b5 reductase 1 [Aspergillus mulundensis]RDW76768.1 NADH-cytochrome b5 reductase 1 [Aspergillus mulundensis]